MHLGVARWRIGVDVDTARFGIVLVVENIAFVGNDAHHRQREESFSDAVALCNGGGKFGIHFIIGLGRAAALRVRSPFVGIAFRMVALLHDVVDKQIATRGDAAVVFPFAVAQYAGSQDGGFFHADRRAVGFVVVGRRFATIGGVSDNGALRLGADTHRKGFVVIAVVVTENGRFHAQAVQGTVVSGIIGSQ